MGALSTPIDNFGDAWQSKDASPPCLRSHPPLLILAATGWARRRRVEGISVGRARRSTGPLPAWPPTSLGARAWATKPRRGWPSGALRADRPESLTAVQSGGYLEMTRRPFSASPRSSPAGLPTGSSRFEQAVRRVIGADYQRGRNSACRKHGARTQFCTQFILVQDCAFTAKPLVGESETRPADMGKLLAIAF